MRKKLFILLIAAWYTGHAQDQPGSITIEKIMQDPKWIGSSPSSPYWSPDGKYLFFYWNPDKAPSDSIYYITKEDLTPHKASYNLLQTTVSEANVNYNSTRSAYTFSRDGDIFWTDGRDGKEKRITQTLDIESDPSWSFHDSCIVYTQNSNLFAWNIRTGLTKQLTNFQKTAAPKKESPNSQEKNLADEQLQNIEALRNRKSKKDLADSIDKINKKELKSIYIEDKILSKPSISADGRFISYKLLKQASGARNTIVPSYVTESGFTTEIPGRTMVGAPQGSFSFYVFDREKDTVINILTDQIPGITDQPDYVKDYPAKNSSSSEHLPKDSVRNKIAPGDSSITGVSKKPASREVVFFGPYWSEHGAGAVMDIRSRDNKDRWLMSLDAATGKLLLLDRQRDEAWIAGPGIGHGPNLEGDVGWIDENIFWYQSEASGYSHLYKINTRTGEKTQLTSGTYEVQTASLSKDKKYFYITTNEVNPGEQQFYRLSVMEGKPERITTAAGANVVTISPDEKQLAILYSYSNRPWELFLQDNKTALNESAHTRQITTLAMSKAFSAYPWRDPEIITFKARDGATVYARIYRPGKNTVTGSKPAVVFVHGAGYLQNAHKYWSYYYHEFMFNNLLADNGFTVLDMDYRGSAGYGRDWRTGIYRHMGGKDLTDQVDGVKWLVEHEGVDPKRVGLYGGSYGGFITLMALFTEPDVFAAGAGLRSVTDWSHYNHGYTSAILNEPFNDSLAYRRSSPIYFAEGLKGHLLMCHGMVDVNVHFEDIVLLNQRLIELGKNNFELAVYPVEDHGFVEASSWTDEYKRVFKLFNTCLK